MATCTGQQVSLLYKRTARPKNLVRPWPGQPGLFHQACHITVEAHGCVMDEGKDVSSKLYDSIVIQLTRTLEVETS